MSIGKPDNPLSIGKPDNPYTAGKQKWTDFDKLGTEAYINGLTKFARKCGTPMTIALQGDWGTGKTSFMNAIREKLSEKPKMETVYFSTWEYSRFQGSDDMYASFVIRVVSQLGMEDDEETKNGLLKYVTKATISTLADTLRDVLNDWLSSTVKGRFVERVINHTEGALKKDIDAFIGREKEKAEAISKLKAEFGKLIAKKVGDGGRVVIFVDDLDRLPPEKAVEFLEVVKLFFDVENCVFVLAIDYNVVVRGVRNKFGEQPEGTERDFFDKIIQLPFRMPLEKYTLGTLLENFFEGKTKYLYIITRFFQNTLGSNPRTAKRLYNYYELLSLVQGKKLDDYDSAILLISLIGRFKNEDTYRQLARMDADALQKLLGVGQVDDEGSKSDNEAPKAEDPFVQQMSAAFTTLADATKKQMEQVCRDYLKMVKEISSVTETDTKSEPQTDNPMIVNIGLPNGFAMPDSVDGLKLSDGLSVADAMYLTFWELWSHFLKDKKEKEALLNDFMESRKKANKPVSETCFSYTKVNSDGTEKAQFKQSREFTGETCLHPDEKSIYLGVYNDTKQKRKHVWRLCAYMEDKGLKIDSVYWDTHDGRRLYCYPDSARSTFITKE